MTKSNSKTPWVFRLGVALLCAMLITTHMMGNLYARYSTTATGGDGARVAKFDVDITLPNPVEDQDKADYKLSAYENGKTEMVYEISITSKSEVAVSYDVILVFSEDFPDWIKTATLIGTYGNYMAIGGKIENGECTFKNAGTFNPAENQTNEHKYTLKIKMPSMADMNTHTYAGVTGAKVTVIVRASQVD